MSTAVLTGRSWLVCWRGRAPRWPGCDRAWRCNRDQVEALAWFSKSAQTSVVPIPVLSHEGGPKRGSEGARANSARVALLRILSVVRVTEHGQAGPGS